MSYDLGDVVPLAVSVKDSAGAAANATAVSVTVTLPDGTTATPTVSNPATGSYTASYTPTQAGRHGVRWLATGTNACAYTDGFAVADTADIPVVSLAEVKAHLNITTTSNDDELRGVIAAAQDAAENYTGRVFGRRTFTETHDGGRRTIALRRHPLVAVATVTQDGVTLSSGEWIVDVTGGVLHRADYGYWSGQDPQNIVVTYTAGYAIQSAAERQGVLEMVRHLWETQRGSLATFPRGDDYAPTVPGYSIPHRVSELWGDVVPGMA